MTDFAKRLDSEMKYRNLSRKDLAFKTGIKKRAIDTYLGPQQSMPPADIAVKIAAALGLSVEYLITGKEYKQKTDISGYLQFKDTLNDLTVLPEETLAIIKYVIKAFADKERKKGD